MGHYTLEYPKGVHYTYALYYPDDYPDSHQAGTAFYIGKGIGNRINDHENDAQRGEKSHRSNVIRKIWANGGQVVRKVLACFQTHEEAIQYEIALIFFMDGLTNKTIGGEGVIDATGEIARKISTKRKGQSYNLTDEQRRKISERHKGRKHSEETRRKMSNAHAGSKHSAESRAKIAAAHEGKPGPKQSPETIAKRVAKLIGKKRTEETKQRMSKALKASPRARAQRRRLHKTRNVEL